MPDLAARIVETTRGAILVCDLRQRIRLTTDAVCTMLGYAEEELVGKPIAAVCEALARDSVDSFLIQLVWFTRTGEPVDVSVSASSARSSTPRTSAAASTKKRCARASRGFGLWSRA